MAINRNIFSVKLLVLLIFATGVAVSILLARFDYLNEKKLVESRFNYNVSSQKLLMEQHINSALHDFQGFLIISNTSQGGYNLQNFEAYSKFICDYNKSIWAVGWLPAVKRENLQQFIQFANNQPIVKLHNFDYKIWEIDDNKNRKFELGSRDIYYPILEFYPHNHSILGFDEGSNPDRLAAITNAVNTGEFASTNLIPLIPQVYEGEYYKDESPEAKAFLFYLPVYRSSSETNTKELSGLLFGLIKLENLLNNSLAALAPVGITAKVYCVNDGKKVLIDDINRNIKTQTRAPMIRHNFGLKTETEISFVNRKILLEFSGSEQYYNLYTTDNEYVIFVLGFLISSLAAAFTYRQFSITTGVKEQVIVKTKELNDANLRLVGANQELTATNEELVSISEELSAAQAELLENELQLKRSIRLLETIISKSPMMIILFDKSKRERTCNDQFSDTFCWNKSDFTNDPDPLSKMVEPSELEKVRELIQYPDSNFREYKLRTIDGRNVLQRWANFDIDEDLIVSIGFDVTQERDLQQKMLIEQKEQNLTMLAGGIAHDFNNILVGVLNGAEMLNEEIPPEATEAKNIIQIIYHSALRMTELTQQMLAYAKGGKYKPVQSNLNTLLLEAVNLTKGVRRSEVSLEINLAPDIKIVNADHSQINQVLINLLVNASEAMPDAGGSIVVNTRNTADIESHIVNEPIADSQYGWVMVSVKDTGHGISSENIAKIFDPFFSTKFVGRGLGLAAVKGIIENHQGYIDVTSEVGIGTEFKVYLPAVSEQTAINLETQHDTNKENRTKSEAVVSHKSSFVLLVEDEPIVRDLVIRILQRSRLSVLYVDTGEEALEMYRARHSEIELVIMDMQLPGISGSNTYRKLRDINPSIKVLFCSGYSHQQLIDELPNDVNVHFIQKPFMPNQLENKLVELKVLINT